MVWRGGSTWTQAHERWLAARHFDDRALAGTYAHYLSTVRLRDTSLEAVEADLLPWCDSPPFGSQVSRLGAYRGVTRIGGLCLAAEVFDWRRFPRANRFPGFSELVRFNVERDRNGFPRCIGRCRFIGLRFTACLRRRSASGASGDRGDSSPTLRPSAAR